MTSPTNSAKLYPSTHQSKARCPLIKRGKTVGIYGPTGSGKTTQLGELAKFKFKTEGKKTVLNTADRGGFGPIAPLVRLGVIQANVLGQDDDPWIWINAAVKGANLSDEIGLVAFDSGSSMGSTCLTAAATSTFQIGQRKAQTFAVARGKETLTVASASDAQYGVVQGFMKDRIWDSSWLTTKGLDVVWTFLEYRSEEADRTPILGPLLVGKALTPVIPSWFEYFWRIASVTQDNDLPKHVLYTAEHSELAGMGHSFGNSRVPLGVEPLPAVIEPASLATVFELIEARQREADDMLKAELGL